MDPTEMRSTLQDLIETLEDGRKGFADAADKLADDGHGEVASRMRELSTQRERFSAELRELAVQHSIDIRDEGSLGGALHRGWMSLKDALTGDDADAVLEAVHSGEEHALSEYDDALDVEWDERVRQVIVRQADAIRDARDEVATLSMD